MTAPAQTHYEVLEVTPEATAEEIRAAYHRLAARYHPDRHQDNPLADLASEKLVALNRAYEILSDPARRAAYDAEQAAQGRRPQGPRVVRPRGPLATLTRLASIVFAVMLVVRAVPVAWRLVVGALDVVGEAAGALAGTPAAAVAVVLGVVAAVVLARRRRARRPRP